MFAANASGRFVRRLCENYRELLQMPKIAGFGRAYRQSGYNITAIGLAVLIIVHYGLSGQRIAWLLQQ
jgi:hypothetical protein